MTVNNGSTHAIDWFLNLRQKEMAVFDFGNVTVENVGVKILLSVILVVSMLFSIVGNLCTCIVIARNRTMRTPTNCYLLNLSITDLITTFYVPVEIYVIWKPNYYPFGELGCRFQFLIWDCVNNCSVLTIVAFTVERYLVVSKPFLRQKLTLKSRVYKIIAVSWLISLLFSVPDVFYIKSLDDNNNNYCYFTLTDSLYVTLPVEILVFFVIPMTIISVLYILIAIKLKSANTKLRNRSGIIDQNRDRAVKMLAAVAASFFLCWAPYCVVRIMILGPSVLTIDNYNTWRVLCCMCCINICLSSAVNPILYCLMSRNFRKAFTDIAKARRSSQSVNRASILNSVINITN